MECLDVWYLITIHASLLASGRYWLGLWVTNWICRLPIIPKPIGKPNVYIAALSRFSTVVSLLVRPIGILHYHLWSLHWTQRKVLQRVIHLHLCYMVVNPCYHWNMLYVKWLNVLLLQFWTKFHACSKLWSLWNMLWTRLLQQCSSKPTSIAGKVRWKLEDCHGLALSTWLLRQAWTGN